MRYLSLFSGMEAAHLAWAPLGWECAGVAEIDPAACALLRHRLPDVPNLGSVTEITDAQVRALGPLDVVIGGSPCQDLSVAGKRAGLAGARSGLFHHQLRIFDAARSLCGARWLVWENVPGAFSSNAGRDFAVVVGALAGSELAVPEDGWGNEGVALGPRGLVEWSVLDAQWFGVAQRRRRVFAVLDTGNWADRRPVLLERDSVRGDFAPRREAGENPSGTLISRAGGGGGPGPDDAKRGMLVAAYGGNNTSGSIDVATARTAHASASGRLDQVDASSARTTSADRSRAAPLATGEVGVRRLTPRECERLQGVPDDYTLVPFRSGKLMQDGPRYKMLGNSFAVPVVRWIGARIQMAQTWAQTVREVA